MIFQSKVQNDGVKFVGFISVLKEIVFLKSHNYIMDNLKRIFINTSFTANLAITVILNIPKLF